MTPEWCEFECGQCVPCIRALAAGTPKKNAQHVENVVELAARERAIVTSRKSTERRN